MANPNFMLLISALFIGLGLVMMLNHGSRCAKPRVKGQKRRYYTYMDIITNRRLWPYIKANPRPFTTMGFIVVALVIGLVFLYGIANII